MFTFPRHDFSSHRLTTMTKAELIEALDHVDDDSPIVFVCDYGDYCHTMQALGITVVTDDQFLEKSAYSHSGMALIEGEVDDEDPDDVTEDATTMPRVVCLSAQHLH